MATVEPGYAAWLKTDARYVGATIAGAKAAWGDKAINATIVSPLAFKADAQAEAVKQAQFHAGPVARDKAIVKGYRKDLIAQVVTLFGDRLGYEPGPSVFVIGAAENANGTTTLTILKRL